jgi:hypothetical protein
MFKNSPVARLASLVALAPLGVLAQSAMPAQPPASSAAPALEYRSTFEGYKRFDDVKVQPWRDSNTTVGQIGGWRAYAKEAQEPAASAPGSATPASTDPHAGHAKP